MKSKEVDLYRKEENEISGFLDMKLRVPNLNTKFEGFLIQKLSIWVRDSYLWLNVSCKTEKPKIYQNSSGQRKMQTRNSYDRFSSFSKTFQITKTVHVAMLPHYNGFWDSAPTTQHHHHRTLLSRFKAC